MPFKFSLPAAATLALAVVVSPAVSAKPFKWSGSSDIQTMDIHSQNSALGNGIHAAVYESLVMFNSRTLRVEPLLATSWQPVSPTQMRFKLRQGVKFSDGSPMTADDVVYSLQRAMSKTSTYAIYTQGMDRIAKVDGETIDIFLKNPNPVLLNQLTELRVMSKAWAEKNNAVEPKDIKAKDETYSHRNAMGTGPFVLKEWVPDQKIVFAANPGWWNVGKAEGNVTETPTCPSSPRRRALPRCCPARWTWCATPASRTWAASRPTRTSRSWRWWRTALCTWPWTSSATSCPAATSRARTR